MFTKLIVNFNIKMLDILIKQIKKYGRAVSTLGTWGHVLWIWMCYGYNTGEGGCLAIAKATLYLCVTK